jgi:signal transduction histidine kinase
MKSVLSKRLNSSGYGQLRWVILLLAVAVILPTVCLLWFMSQAVKNVQLAARQKLMAVYEDKLADASRETNESWAKELERVDKLIDQNLPSDVFDNLSKAQEYSVIVYDENSRRFYPLISTDVKLPIDPAEEFAQAWALEFAQQSFTEAAKLYEEKAQSNNDYIRFSALIGWSRCLAKLGDMQQAIEACKKVAFSPEEETCDTATLMLIASARLLLVQLLKPELERDQSPLKDHQLFQDALAMLLKVVSRQSMAISFLPSDQNMPSSFLPLDQSVFLAHRALDLSQATEGIYGLENPMMLENMMPGDIEFFEQMMLDDPLKWQSVSNIRDDGGLTLAMIDRFPTAAKLQDWTTDQFRQLQLDEQSICYGVRHNVGGNTVLLLQPSQIWSFHHYADIFRRTGVTCRILDNLGRPVDGDVLHHERPFMRLPVGGYFADWQAELYFTGDDIFETTARRQIAIYIWAGVLVIVLILAVGGFAGRAVGRQIKLSRLKNDFIATVSHELKTPLASMRVLVDTLLEGNYKDQQQATEYLQLTGKENERLSRLIDNFLTFSRMERNKQAFEIVRTSPAAIAHAAAAAVKTEFSQSPCKFDVSIRDDLPDVLADHDAIVTVLVNLLDNAYKYSYDDKRIELNVFAQDRLVCFCVSDHGIGMSRRTAKKIFKRFYQVDRSLSRHAQGCGLGLSIAKFIVDAHKGSISVDSELGKGSTFTVKLPAVN